MDKFIRFEAKINDYLKELITDKNVLILGFGREGRSTYGLLKKVGGFKELAVSDFNQISDIDETVYSGEGYQECIPDYDIVFKSPGVVLKQLHHSAKIISQTDVMIKCFKHNMIGITGTKGKSTTTSLIYHILSFAGKKTVLMGNIGIPAFEAVSEVTEDSYIVYELSCHQLEFAEESPSRGVLLNIFPEHLDHYGTFEKYKHAKENMWRNMTKGDLLVCGTAVIPEHLNHRCVTVSMEGNTGNYTVSENAFYADGNEYKPECKLFGIHNMYNCAMAHAVCADCGISDDVFMEALKTYNPLPHRLELFAEIDGVRYFDDSISTIPETAIKAVSSIDNVGTLILGGMDRGIDLNPLCDFLKKTYVKNIILMPDTGKIIYNKLKDECMSNLVLVNNLEEAVKACKNVTSSGEACILSPAAASYGFFKNFEERGDKFKELVFENN